MSEFMVNAVGGTGAAGGITPLKADQKSETDGGFAKAMDDALGKVNSVNTEAEQAVQNLVKGGDITDTILAMEKADMSFQVMLEVRNQLVSAYQEVMRMQV